jgi:site-specific DNA-methyltransferase (adenine-specific)
VRFPDADALFYLPFNVGVESHLCPKPLVMCRFLIEHLTRPDDIVLDCFCGSGSILVAAAQLGRRYIGYDLSEQYCKISQRRLAFLERK